MSTESKMLKSLEAMFLGRSNIKYVESRLGRSASIEMKTWTLKQSLDDYESVQSDFSEALDFANKQFIKAHQHEEYGISTAEGQNYPKCYIKGGVEGYNPEDWGMHDAQFTQEVFRSNNNFRYKNEIKQWRIGQHKHHYDRVEHEAGLKDTRELNNHVRGYNMKDVLGSNPYVSSDSLLFAGLP
jgi:hypothetical protein